MKALPRLLPGLQRNVGTAERIVSLALGSYLLYRALNGKHRVLKAIGAYIFLFRGLTANCPLYDAMNINMAEPPKPVRLKTSLTINKPRQQVYDFWRKLENLPSFMKHLESVTTIDDKHSQWSAKIPGGLGTIEWESEITADVNGEKISWRSIENAQIENAGSVAFSDAGKYGTAVEVNIAYRAPAGYVGKGIAKWLNPLTEGMIREDIKNFRRIMETGELPTIEGQASGKNK